MCTWMTLCIGTQGQLGKIKPPEGAKLSTREARTTHYMYMRNSESYPLLRILSP